MGKSHLNHYQSIAMVHGGPEVYVVSVCHASVSRMDIKCNSDFSEISQECMETLPSNTSVANCNVATGLAPAELL